MSTAQDDPAGATAAARPTPAASLILARRGPAGFEALMGARGRRAAFMARKRVFPGGALEPGDGRAAAGSDAPAAETVAPIARDVLIALGRCALREAREETGLVVRDRLDLLRLVGRAITPVSSPKRFDAWFFVAIADEMLVDPQAAPTGDGELSDWRWTPLAQPPADAPFPTALMMAESAAGLSDAEGPPHVSWPRPALFLDQADATAAFRAL